MHIHTHVYSHRVLDRVLYSLRPAIECDDLEDGHERVADVIKVHRALACQFSNTKSKEIPSAIPPKKKGGKKKSAPYYSAPCKVTLCVFTVCSLCRHSSSSSERQRKDLCQYMPSMVVPKPYTELNPIERERQDLYYILRHMPVLQVCC